MKASQQNSTRSARHFRKMKGQRRLRAVVVSFHPFVPWWSSRVTFSLSANGFNCFTWGFCPCFYPAFKFAVMFTVFNLFLVLLLTCYFKALMMFFLWFFFFPSEASSFVGTQIVISSIYLLRYRVVCICK